MLISGGTGSGKTTLLNALTGFIDARERVVTIEETAELRLARDHVVRLEARPANAEGSGAVSVRDLVRAALRMRPDRLVIGEVRGAEALDLLQALNTGHEGSLSTVHANSPLDALRRLSTLALFGNAGLPAPTRFANSSGRRSTSWSRSVGPAAGRARSCRSSKSASTATTTSRSTRSLTRTDGANFRVCGRADPASPTRVAA